MIAKRVEAQAHELAERSFQVITQILLSLPQGRRRDLGNLKEMEFFTLSILQQNQPMIVGKIQKILGVLPAQMSRIIRSLESRDRPLICCEINPGDKRKINVRLTTAGEKALADYLSPRVEVISDLLEKLNEEDREELAGLLQKLDELVDQKAVLAETN